MYLSLCALSIFVGTEGPKKLKFVKVTPGYPDLITGWSQKTKQQ